MAPRLRRGRVWRSRPNPRKTKPSGLLGPTGQGLEYITVTLGPRKGRAEKGYPRRNGLPPRPYPLPPTPLRPRTFFFRYTLRRPPLSSPNTVPRCPRGCTWPGEVTGLHSTAAGWLRETLPEGTRIEDPPPEQSRWFPDAVQAPQRRTQLFYLPVSWVLLK